MHARKLNEVASAQMTTALFLTDVIILITAPAVG
jgi:hypothetical protein